jgi:triosephosphate isomerase
MRKIVIAGNWKMNKGVAASVELATQIAALAKPVAGVEVVIAPTFLAAAKVADAIKGSAVKLAVQDIHWRDQGAFTGKISVDMVKELNVSYIIIGHSEQRQYFGETDETVNNKVKKTLEAGIQPMICIGETLAERNGGKLEAVLSTQLKGAFAGLTAEQAALCVIAYEPVWAIGTGVTATDAQAQDTQAFVRSVVQGLYGASVAGDMTIQYGGSMNAGNALGLLGQADIDGGLIGGAALKPDTFIAIVDAANNVVSQG